MTFHTFTPEEINLLIQYSDYLHNGPADDCACKFCCADRAGKINWERDMAPARLWEIA